MLDTFKRHDKYNALVTTLFRKLKNPNQSNDQNIYGFMIICNEDDEQEIDFTMEDYNYILDKMEDVKYLPQQETFDWEEFLERLEDKN